VDPPADEVTRLLAELNHGNEQALSELMPLIYAELKRLAGYYLRQERPNHTLQATALVHEAYVRLVGQRQQQWQNKSQFVRVAASIMRRILVDYSRNHDAEKRGGKGGKVLLDETRIVLKGRTADIVAVDEVLNRLAEIDPQQAHVVELRFFAGLSIEEAAGALGISPATVKRDWNVAKTWLAREMKSNKDDHG
jgi:RNA polymerase sigma-70 factor (ECF subfamily)